MSSTRYSLSLVVFLLITLGYPTYGADQKQSTQDDTAVRQTVTAALEAVKKSNWKDLAKQLHPDAHKAIKDVLVNAWTDPKGDSERTAATRPFVMSLLDAAPKDRLKAVKEIEGILALEPEPLVVRVLEKIAAQAAQHPDSAAQYFAVGECRIIGAVFEKKDLSHVVVEQKRKIPYLDRADTRMHVFTLKQTGAEWRIVNSPVLQDVWTMRIALKGEE